MLIENDVVKAVARHLDSEGYCVEKVLSTVEHGVDIVAVHPETHVRLLVEAKGGTSSKKASARFGKPFTRNQAKTHVAVALYYAAMLRQEYSSEGARVALAFPDDKNHTELVEDISSALRVLQITAFFVDGARRVRALPFATR